MTPEILQLAPGHGNGTQGKTYHLDDWRLEIVTQALGGLDNAEYTNAMLRALRQAIPDRPMSISYLDRRRLEAFLEQPEAHTRDLLPASTFNCERWDDFQHWESIGWYNLTWKEEKFEVVLVPSCSLHDDAIVIGPSKESLRIFIQALIDWCERPAGRSLRYSNGWSPAPDLDRQIGKIDWNDVVLSEETMGGVREAVDGFFRNREVYSSFGFAWRRGVLLIGPPGTGKTMICKAIAATTPDLPFLYVRDVREFEEKESIRRIFHRARRLAPCILAFEDIDGFITDENRTIFLNEMDGFSSNDGLLIIASSNHPHKIDEALLKRPSRFDRVFHIGLPGPTERTEFCRRLLARPQLSEHMNAAVDREKLAKDVAARSHGFTPAYLKEAFTAAALQCVQNGDLELDERFTQAVLAQVTTLRKSLRRAKSQSASSAAGDCERIGFRRHIED